MLSINGRKLSQKIRIRPKFAQLIELYKIIEQYRVQSYVTANKKEIIVRYNFFKPNVEVGW